jgi:hypothetical protein
LFVFTYRRPADDEIYYVPFGVATTSTTVLFESPERLLDFRVLGFYDRSSLGPRDCGDWDFYMDHQFPRDPKCDYEDLDSDPPKDMGVVRKRDGKPLGVCRPVPVAAEPVPEAEPAPVGLVPRDIDKVLDMES